MALLLIVSVLLFSLPEQRSQSCSCGVSAPDETTHSGGNEIVTFIEKETYRSVRGLVLDANGEPLEGVLVELFDKPEWIRKGLPSSPQDQRRIAACKTGSDGRFCIENVRAGEYELRGSIDSAWNPSHVLLKVNPNARKTSRKAIELQMKLGT